MNVYTIVRDLLVVLGLGVGIWQLLETQRSLELAGSALVMGPYLEARSEMLAAGLGDAELTDDDIMVLEYLAVASILCELENRGTLNKGLSDFLKRDAKDLGLLRSINTSIFKPGYEC